MKKKVAIIQARMNSSRLPGKVLFKLEGYEVLKLVYDRVKKSNVDDVIIATTHNPLDNKIEQFCERNEIKCFRGSEDNVLSRVHQCAFKHNTDIIVEITADCPFVDYRHINKMLEFFDEALTFQYVSNCFPRSWFDGFDIQIYNMFALSIALTMVHNKEHVGWNIQRFLSKYNQNIYRHYPAPEKYRLPEIAITLDTKEDFNLLTLIAQYFIVHKIKLDEVSAEEIIDLLLERPELLDINNKIVRKVPE